MQIQQNAALFSILGTTYGGNGTTTFALPDLRGRVPIGMGQAPGLSDSRIGQAGGVESVALLSTQIPAHIHALQAAPASASAGPAVVTAPAGGAQVVATQASGGSLPHENRQPFLVLNYIIATTGIYPVRD